MLDPFGSIGPSEALRPSTPLDSTRDELEDNALETSLGFYDERSALREESDAERQRLEGNKFQTVARCRERKTSTSKQRKEDRNVTKWRKRGSKSTEPARERKRGSNDRQAGSI